MYFLYNIRRIKHFIKYMHPLVRSYSTRSVLTLHKTHLKKKPLCYTCSNVLHRTVSDDSNNLVLDDMDDIAQLIQYNDTLQHQYVKNSLYPNSSDDLIQKLNHCESIQEVFETVKANLKDFKHQHITQAVLVLWDLQKMCLYSQNLHYVSESDPLVQDYMQRLINHPDFKQLIEVAKEKHDDFDAESIGCFLLYINKMGVVLNHDFLEFFLRLQHLFKTDMSLTALSRIIVAVRSELNFSSLYLVLDTVPFILNELDKCQTLEDLKLITICLNHLHQVVTDDVLEKYMQKVKQIVGASQLDRTSFRTLLKILSFLHYPQWSNRCTNLSSELVLKMKDNLHSLTVYELFILFEILFKNQEPAEVLTEMQRCASRLFLNLEEDFYMPLEMKLKLLSCIVCFSSPLNRHGYQKMVNKFIKELPTNLNASYDLLRILTFIKPSDTNMCKSFWDNVLNILNNSEFEKEDQVLLRLCLKYMNSTNDIRYRHKEFEKQMLKKLEKHLHNGTMLIIPSQLSIATTFLLAFGTNRETISTIVDKVTQCWTQFNYLDCLYMSKGLRNMEYMNRSSLTSCQFNGLQDALDKAVSENLKFNDPSKNNFLLKSCIYRKSSNNDLTKVLLHNLNTGNMSSSFLRNVVFSLQTTGSLLPDLMESMCDYVTSCKDYILGFNAEKVAFLCYYLGYLPKNYEAIFQCIADMIIRDQERISSLSYIQVALALCFFDKLPDSFIKHIFNVNFLEKIDAELTTCYFKDRYPVRVRNSMMQLNRAVCLDYPEASVPWFHQKFIRDSVKKAKESSRNYLNLNNYLLRVVDDPQFLGTDVFTPYGYQVDFLIEFDDEGRFVTPDDQRSATKVAILAMNQNCYTTVNVQLKGKYQMKKRHLEILGYKVVLINLKEWNSLILGEDKLEYLNKLICPNTLNKNKYVVKR